jgi:hypothetical protein
MRLVKVLCFTLGAMMLVAPGMAFGQVSDSDTVEIIDPFDGDNTVEIANTSIDTNFHMAIMMANASILGSITIPLTLSSGGIAEVMFDVAVDDGAGNLAITQGPHGRAGVWVIRSSLVDSNNQTNLIGYLNFSSFLPAARDTLCLVYFDINSPGGTGMVPVDSGLLPPANRLTMVNTAAQEFIPTFTRGVIDLGTAVGGETGITPLTYGLEQNFPNPFNAQTRISFSMPVASHVDLRVYNVLGQEVVKLVDQQMLPAEHEVVWDGASTQGNIVASGTYFYRLKIGDEFEETRQMTLLK